MMAEANRKKTTVAIDAGLRDKIKSKIIGSGLTIEKVVELAIRSWLKKPQDL